MGKRTAVEMVADTFGSTSSTEARGYDAMAVANWFIREAVSDRRPLDLLTLLKLIYLAHGYSTLREGGSKPDSPGLINDKFQAWKYGPVVPRVYKLLRQQGIIIDESLNDEAWGDDSERLSQCSEDVDLLRRVYKKYRDSDAFALSVETHGESSPWKKAMVRGETPREVRQADIRAYFNDHHRLSDLPDLEEDPPREKVRWIRGFAFHGRGAIRSQAADPVLPSRAIEQAIVSYRENTRRLERIVASASSKGVVRTRGGAATSAGEVTRARNEIAVSASDIRQIIDSGKRTGRALERAVSSSPPRAISRISASSRGRSGT